MNVPSLSERTLRRDIEKSEISVGSEIQVVMLGWCFWAFTFCPCLGTCAILGSED